MAANGLHLSLILAGVVLAFLGGYLTSNYTANQDSHVEYTNERHVDPVREEAKDVVGENAKPEKVHKQAKESAARVDAAEEQEIAPALANGHMQPLGSHREPSEQIRTLDLIPSSPDFYRMFLRPRKPVLLRGAAKSWPAFQHWKDSDYLKARYGDVQLKVETRKRYNNEGLVKKVMNLSEFLDVYETESFYMDSPFVHTAMMSDVLVPPCLSCPELLKTISSSHLLFSSGNTSSSLHHDGYDNMLALLSGRKQVMLIAPKFADHIYVNDYITFPGLSPIEPDMVDLEKYPLMRDVTYGIVDMEPGDILYIPMYMFHHVRSYDSPNIAANIWFYPFDFDDEMARTQIPDSDTLRYTLRYNEVVQNLAPAELNCSSLNTPLNTILNKSTIAEDIFSPDEIKEAAKVVKPTVKLNSGYEMPVIGYGTSRVSGEKAVDAIKKAIEIGYRLIDTAQGYDEPATGKAVAESNVPRSEIFILTKIHPKFNGYKTTLASIDQSLKNLQTDYIDCVLIHSTECDDSGTPLECPGQQTGPWQGTWRALEKAHRDGKVRSIGVSNFETVEIMRELVKMATVPVSVVQNYFDMYDTSDAVRSFCKQHGIHFMAYGILGAVWMDEGAKSNPILNNDHVLDMAYGRQCTAVQVVLRWGMQLGVVVLARSLNPVHMEINLHANDIHLKESEMNLLGSLSGKLTMDDIGPNGEIMEQRTPPEGISQMIGEEVELTRVAVFAGSDDGRFTALNGTDGHIHWQFKTFNEFGSTCIFTPDETVLMFSTEDQHVYALSVSTGETMWSFTDRTGDGFIATPRLGVNHDRVFLGSLSGTFFCLDAMTGNKIWSVERGNEIWSTAAVALVGRKETVFFGTMGPSENFLALDVSNGEVKWSRTIRNGVWASPSLSHDNTFVFVAAEDGFIYCIRTINGKIKWRYSAGAAAKSTPVVSEKEGVLYGASTGGRIFALNIDDGKEKWRYDANVEIVSTPALAPNNLLIIGTKGKQVLALTRDGSVAWSYDTPGDVWATSVISRDGLAYFGSIDGHMYALNAKDGSLLWRTKVATFAASPCLSPKFRYME